MCSCADVPGQCVCSGGWTYKMDPQLQQQAPPPKRTLEERIGDIYDGLVEGARYQGVTSDELFRAALKIALVEYGED